MFTIKLGAKVTSNITGFSGIVTSRSEHINGCNRYWVQPPLDKDGKMQDGCWVDEAELVVTEEPTLPKTNPDRGGPYSKIK
jgi:hypothetical protein